MNKINFQRLKRGWNRLNLIKRMTIPFSQKNPVYVFHHIPKCGGTSLIQILNKWFVVIHDYRKDWSNSHPLPINIKKLKSIHCLAGHWELPGVYLKERYPEVFSNDRYKVFTFLRDPLRHSLSLYRYEKENNQTDITEIEEHFSIRTNYIATILNANYENYKDVLDQYFFIGILEEVDKSLNRLTNLIGKKKYKLPWINKTRHGNKTDLNKISTSTINKFKKSNELDYLIYNYALKKLNANINN